MAPAMKGAIAGIAASVVLGIGDSKLSLGGMVLGAPVVIGVSVASASLASELSHDYILAKIKPNASLADFEAKALAPALRAAATIGAAYLTIGPVTDMRAALELAVIGAGSEIGGAYAHSMIMSLMTGHNAVQAIHGSISAQCFSIPLRPPPFCGAGLYGCASAGSASASLLTHDVRARARASWALGSGSAPSA